MADELDSELRRLRRVLMERVLSDYSPSEDLLQADDPFEIYDRALQEARSGSPAEEEGEQHETGHPESSDGEEEGPVPSDTASSTQETERAGVTSGPTGSGPTGSGREGRQDSVVEPGGFEKTVGEETAVTGANVPLHGSRLRSEGERRETSVAEQARSDESNQHWGMAIGILLLFIVIGAALLLLF